MTHLHVFVMQYNFNHRVIHSCILIEQVTPTYSMNERAEMPRTFVHISTNCLSFKLACFNRRQCWLHTRSGSFLEFFRSTTEPHLQPTALMTDLATTWMPLWLYQARMKYMYIVLSFMCLFARLQELLALHDVHSQSAQTLLQGLMSVVLSLTSGKYFPQSNEFITCAAIKILPDGALQRVHNDKLYNNMWWKHTNWKWSKRRLTEFERRWHGYFAKNLAYW